MIFTFIILLPYCPVTRGRRNTFSMIFTLLLFIGMASIIYGIAEAGPVSGGETIMAKSGSLWHRKKDMGEAFAQR